MSTVVYEGKTLVVRCGAWEDEMNSCFYTCIDSVSIPGYIICRENGTGELFALRGTLAVDVSR